MPLQLTENAAKEIKKVIAEQKMPENSALRVSVGGGGCSGFEYKLEFDESKRLTMLHEMDQILFDTHMFALGWYGPNFRILYWDKFGHPPEYASRFAGELRNVLYFWWFDDEKAARVEKNRREKVSSYPDRKGGQYDEIEQRYWLYNTLPMKDE